MHHFCLLSVAHLIFARKPWFPNIERLHEQRLSRPRALHECHDERYAECLDGNNQVKEPNNNNN